MLKVNLSRTALLSAGAESSTKDKGNKDNRYTVEILTLDGRGVQVDESGSPCFYEGNLYYEIPSVFTPFITTVSYYDNFGNGLRPKRQLGEYRLKSASGTVEVSGGSHYHLKLQAKNLEDLREAYHLIREGKIWPAKDYEADQVPRPCQNLRALLKEAWQLIHRDVSDQLYRIREKVIKTNI